jgi:HSP20 family protein
MSMMRWEPFSQLMSLRQAMYRLFEDSFVRPSRVLFGEGVHIPLDIHQTADEVTVKASLPGVKPKDVDISITGDTLTIKGEAKAQEIKQEDYLCQEWRYGAFARSVTLPGALKTDKVEATFENGVLTVSIPKAEEAKPKTIKVKAKGIIEGKK